MGRKQNVSSHLTVSKRVTLLVSSTNDDWVLDCAERLAEAGASVDLVPNVYAAMARLTLDTDIRRVLLDIRTMDKGEAAFLRVAARYYPSIDVIIPAFPGAAERAAALGIGLPPTSVDAVTAAAELEDALAAPTTDASTEVTAAAAGDDATDHVTDGGVTEADVEAPPGELAASLPPQTPTSQADPVQQEPPLDPNDELPLDADSDSVAAPTGALSTDGGPESAPAGPSLHDAVRARMAGDDPRTSRRPPQRVAPQHRDTNDNLIDPPASRASEPGRPPASRAVPGPVPLPKPDHPSEPLPPAKPSLSQDEVNALLGDDESVEPDLPSPDGEQGGAS